MMDHIDPHLFEQIDEAGEDHEVEAVMMLAKDPGRKLPRAAASTRSASKPAALNAGDDRGAADLLIDRVSERVHQVPSRVRFMPKLGILVVKGTGPFIRQLLEEDEVISATSSESAFAIE